THHQNSQGIQTLLEAEKEAAKIVQKARQYRVQRLKDARTDAARAIEELKEQKNSEFQNFEAEHVGSSDQSNVKVAAETDEKLVEVQKAFEKNKNSVIDKLLFAVTNVEPKVHINVKLRK
ncbi:5660_t:CDS:2, partial [Funneliformis geosporum]